MKKFWLLLLPVFLLVGCNEDEIDNLKQDYINGHKSDELIGFWEHKGGYKVSYNITDEDLLVNNGTIEVGEILLLDNNYLYLLKKDSSNEPAYYTNKFYQQYWYNTDKFIKTLVSDNSSSGSHSQAHEAFLPYKFGETNDTLIVQSDSKVYYLLKTDEIAYEFIVSE